MKMMRKIATLLLAVCLVVPCFSMLTHAANGKIMFTDPSTAVGQTLELKGVLEADESIEDRTIVMSYDTTMLKFKNGDNVTETASGELKYEVTGQQSGTRVEFLMYFDVLKEGTTKVEVKSYKAYATSNASISCTEGSSTITIAAGDSTTVTEEPDEDPNVNANTGATAIVEVNGVSYTLTDEFEEDDIPDGFVEATMEYDGAQYRVVKMETAEFYLGYLVDAEEEGKFFVYESEDATFAPFEEIELTDEMSIILLSNVDSIVLPTTYKASKLSINEVEFPAWKNSEKEEFWVFYAINSNGEKSLYQFDTEEKTYQRFEAPAIEEVEEEDTSFIGKISAALEDHMNTAVIVVGLVFIIFVVLIIVLSVKLCNRNAELDELYDEYGIDLDDGEEEDDDAIVRIDIDDMEEEPEFEDIKDETEDDVLIGDELESEEDSEVEVEFFEQEQEEEKDSIEEVRLELEEETSFYDDDDDLDFEMDFIDLDD